jgi:uncharacterized membrane protein YqjE
VTDSATPNDQAAAPDIAPRDNASGAATGLFKSLTNLFATLAVLAQTRLELLTTELQEEVHRARTLVVWTFIAILAAALGLFFGGLTIVIIYWDTHRILAALLVTSSFIAFAVVSAVVLIAKINSRPRFLDATLTELAKDADSLKSRL